MQHTPRRDTISTQDVLMHHTRDHALPLTNTPNSHHTACVCRTASSPSHRARPVRHQRRSIRGSSHHPPRRPARQLCAVFGGRATRAARPSPLTRPAHTAPTIVYRLSVCPPTSIPTKPAQPSQLSRSLLRQHPACSLADLITDLA